VEFEPTIAAGERPYTYALDRAATGIGSRILYGCKNILWLPFWRIFNFMMKRSMEIER